MSEPANVRLVRCPKCENLLPELTNYSVYQCGGCGTVLRAKNRNIEADTLSEKSDKERGLGVCEKISNKSENFNLIKKGKMSSRDGLENDVKSIGSSSSRDENREISSESAVNCSKIKADKWVLENDLEINENLDEFEELEPQNRSQRSRQISDSNCSKIRADKWVLENDLQMNENLDGFGHLKEGKEFGELRPQIESVNGSRRSRESSGWNASKIRADKWVLEEDLEVKLNLNEFGHLKNGKEFEELRPQNEHVIGSRRSRQISDWRIEEKSEMERFQRNPRDSKYLEEGPSNYQPSYGYAEPVKNRIEPDRFNKVDYDENDREELLRKIDELKDQLSHTRDVKDKPKGKIPVVDRRTAYQDPYDGPMGSNTASMQYPIPDRYMSRPPYMNNYMDPSPFMNRNEMAMHGFYSNQGIVDPVRSQMLGRAPHQAPGPFQQHQSHPYFSGQYVDTDVDTFETYPHNINLHPHSCSCFHCYSKHRQVPIPPPPSSFSNKMLPDFPKNPMHYPHENPGSFGPRDYNPRISNPPQLNPHNPQSHTRWPSDLSSEVGGFVRRRPPPRVLVASSGRRCRPIAGGAPFVTCYSCFELLQIPKKVLITEKKSQKKIQCGACSSITLFAVVNKKLVISTHEEKKRIPPTKVDIVDTPIVVVNRAGMSFSSDDYGDPNYDFQSMDKELTSSSNKQREMRSLQSTTPSSSEDEDSPDSLINSIEPLVKANLPSSPPPAGSPLQDHFDYSTKYRVVKRSEKGNQSGRSDQEKMMPQKVTSRQNSMKEASMATELELSSNEYLNTGVSQDSGEASREEYQLRGNKGAESFFAGIIKKSFRDFSRSNQIVENGKANVSVNGQFISDRLVKKAEKLAGPIHPGEYWYDFRAGFWGVMGGPCLGIVPPFIEEFNYPIPENCSFGNSGVFVNGRELHQKDLDLLGSRGLPTARDRSYIIEISGRVLDEDSGEELDSLGKLAPTVERVKHGFGMKTPRAAAN